MKSMKNARPTMNKTVPILPKMMNHYHYNDSDTNKCSIDSVQISSNFYQSTV